MQSSDQETIRRFLLGDVSDDEREQIERRLLTDGDFAEQVSLWEGELADEYVRGALGAGERDKFERCFLSTFDGVEQIRLAAVLQKYASSAAAARAGEAVAARGPIKRGGFVERIRSRIAVEYVLAGALLMAVLIAAYMVTSNLRLRGELDRLRAQQASGPQELQKQLADEQALNAQLAEQLKSEQDHRSQIEQELASLKGSKGSDQQAGVPAIFLTPGRIRGEAQSQRLVVEPGTRNALIHLIVRDAEDYSYRASLYTEAGEEVLPPDSLKAQHAKDRKEVQVNLPLKLLSSGNYFVKLQAAPSGGDYEDVGRYYFKLIKK